MLAERGNSPPRTQGAADVIMVDPYPVGVDAASCTTTFGCCGCDDCVGSVRDVARRLDTVATMLDPRKQLWLVLQAFGGHGHWARAPSPAELRCMTYLGLQHGATLPSPSAACALKEHTGRGQPQASSQVSRKRGGP